jgi:hypothetical protein
MGVGDVLDETFRIYRRHFMTFLVAMLVVVVPLTALPAAVALAALGATDLERLAEQLQGPDAGGPFLVGLGSVLLVYLLIAGVGYTLNTIAIIRLSSDAILGRPLEIGRSYGDWAGPLGRIFLLGLLALVAWVLVAGAFGLLVAAGSALGAGVVAIVAVLAVLAGMPLAVYVFLGFAVTLQALVLERRGPLDSLGRSWGLAAGSRWRILAIGFIIGILVSLLASIPAFAVQMAAAAAIAAQDSPGMGAVILAQAVNISVQAIAQAVFGAIGYIASTILYYELRVRKEAFDLEHQTGQPGEGGAPLAPP